MQTNNNMNYFENTDHYIPKDNNNLHWHVKPHGPQQNAIYKIR